MKEYFKMIYDQYHGKVFLFVKHYVNAEPEAQDIVQEVFIHLWKHVKTLRATDDPQPIIFKTAKQEIANHFRKRRIHFSFLDHDAAALDIADDPGDQDDLQPKICKINSLIAVLPDRRRSIFLDSVLDEMSYSEIAYKHKISKSAVAKQIVKALRFIKSGF